MTVRLDFANPIHRRSDPMVFWRGALFLVPIGILCWYGIGLLYLVFG